MSVDDRQRSDSFPDPEISTHDDEGVMVPPWVKYPNLPRKSMGWRMGLGEQYVEDFQRWSLAQPRASRIAARGKYPEPLEWTGFYRNLD